MDVHQMPERNETFERWYKEQYSEWWKDCYIELQIAWRRLQNAGIDDALIEVVFSSVANAIRSQYGE